MLGEGRLLMVMLQITVDDVNVLFEFGMQQFNCGNYAAASDLLYQFRILSTDSDKTTQATWGKLACEILRTDWDAAMEEIIKVRDNVAALVCSSRS